MAKALRVPVLVFENKEEVEIIASALNLYSEEYGGERQKKVDKVRNEIHKIIVFSRKQITTRILNNLVKKALKDKPIFKPSKGYQFLKDVPVGSLFKLSNNTKGILLEISTNAKVHFTDVPSIIEEDKKSYLGRKIISVHTEVKII